MNIRKKPLKTALGKGKTVRRKHIATPRSLRILGKVFAILAAVYAALFTVFFFDLDGKLIYYVAEPFLVRHYDKMARRNPLDMLYKTE